MDHLTIGLATRGRPELLTETVKRTAANIRGNTTFVVLADDDDETMKGWSHPGVVLSIEPRPDTIAEKWNRMARVAPADFYMMMVDHSPCVTPGFDIIVKKQLSLFPDGIGGGYGHLFCLSFPHFNAATAKMVKIMGGFYPTHFPYWFVDHWFDDICRMIGRFVLCDVQMDNAKRPGTQEMREPGLWASVYDSLYKEREEIANRLLDAMDEPEWKKQVLRDSFPLHHERSMYINAIVRGLPAKESDFDERYLRIREKSGKHLMAFYEELKAA